MKTLRLAGIPLAVLLVVGCATSYGPYEYWRGGGYTDQRLPDGTYLVTVRFTGAMDDQATAFEYFHRRAAEIAVAGGCKTYEVLEMGGGSEEVLAPVGSLIAVLEYPNVSGRIRCVRE